MPTPRPDPFLSRPVVAALFASLGLGTVLTARCWMLEGGVGVPDTLFSDGHIVGTTLGAELLWSGEPWAFSTERAAWPSGARLRPLLWPVALLAGVVGPAIALTLSWMLTPALGVLGGASLARSLGAGSWGAALSGTLLAWAPWVRTTLANGQVEQAALGGVALAWAAAVFSEDGGWVRVGLAPTVMLALGLAAPNLVLTAGIGLGLLALVRVLQSRRRLVRHGVVLVLGLAACGVSAAYHGAAFTEGTDVFRPRERAPDHVRRAREAQGPIAGWDAVDTAQLEDATPTALFVPPGPRAFERPAQHAPFLGYGLLLAAIVGVVRRPREALPLLGVGVGFCVLSLGARLGLSATHYLPLPWAIVESLFPAVARSGSPYRLATGAIVALSAAAGVGASGWRLRAAIPVLASLAWLETTLLPGHPLPFAPLAVGGHGVLDALAGSGPPVLDLPLPLEGACEGQAAHYLAGVARHGRPYLHTAVAANRLHNFGEARGRVRGVDQVLRSPGCAGALPGALKAAELGALVAHRDAQCAISPEVEACLRAALGAPLREDDEAVVWVLD